MYTQFFGLREKPFAITPDPQYLYLSHRHGEALAHLLYGVTESGGFIQLTGEVGTGKTMLTRTLLEKLPDEIDLALVLNPRLSAQEFIEAIFDELHIPMPASNSIREMIDRLNKHLLEVHAAGRRTVLLVDEAQNLDRDVLEQLRLLTNLETAKEKLLQIILVGQPELRETLARNDLRQLAQRITGRYHLGNLSQEETAVYVQHRITVAGAERPIFSNGALAEIYRRSGGVPRLINIIADRALLGGYTEEKPVIGRKLVRQAAAEISGKPPKSVSDWIPEAGIAAGIIGAAALLVWLFINDRSPVAEATPVTGALTPAQQQLQQSIPPQQKPGNMSLANSLTRSDPGPAILNGAPLTDVLSGAGNLTGTDAAISGLLQLWQADLSPGPEAPCDKLRVIGLKCEFQVGSWTLLEQLNRPAILSLIAPDGETHQVVVAGLADDKARLLVGDQFVEVDSAELRQLWFGESLLLWKPNPLADSLMVPGTSSEGIGWLRQALEQLQDGAASATTSIVYDETLEDRVRRFQRQAGLEVDGLAGIHTLIALNNVLEDGATPRLRNTN